MRLSPTGPIRSFHRPIEHPRDGVSADLWIWQFGVALLHIIEDVELASLASFAVWHRRVYDEQMGWANKIIRSQLASGSTAQYAMPVNWILRPTWTRDQIDTALRVLTAPRILLQRTSNTDSSDLAHAELVERTLLHNGLDRFDSFDFGIQDISAGVASWSGVVYLPFAPDRALSESEVLGYERTVQAAWSYCDWIRSQVEMGNRPDIPPEHGPRLLRALRSIITNPRSEESSQFYPLRTAIIATSGIAEHLTQATDATAEKAG